ncbi:sodium-dependent bicarbonate transport family permease [Methylotenera mobilis]|uniref:sodium-dependent bicarbonate transport family permease n=1 Tax=Methylotenera mobilis TaxID=359408 RepID=UPI0006864A27|nr:sodium-dependent bicarbonate transport family permease [Methylotenera mobilis]
MATITNRDYQLNSFQSLLTPSIMFFALGFVAQLIKSDLKLPVELTKSITIYLLISVGIHGGIELSHATFLDAVPSIFTAVALGVLLPIIAYLIINKVGKIDHLNAVAIATHYGSVSAGTFLTAIAFLEALHIDFEKYPIIMLAIMESPAILVGLVMASYLRGKHLNNSGAIQSNKSELIKEAFTNGSIVLLMGGLLIGDIATEKSIKTILPFFDHLFMGVLCVFLLSMGMEAGKKISDFKVAGKFLICFGALMPLISGLIGVMIGAYLLNFSVGGSTLVGVLAASASYIAVPPAMRMAIPEANPSIYLTLALGITFPFNVLFGIPLYYSFANFLL